MSRSNRHRGFSMVEILVVIGVILVLLSLLLPSLGRARGQARMTYCANQLRAIYTAETTWKAANDQANFQAEGWRTTLAPIVHDLQVYNCPEARLADPGSAGVTPGDTAGSGPTSGENGPTAGGTSPTSNLPDLSNAFFHVVAPGGGYVWDCPLAPGPWAHQLNVTPTGYDLGFEDLGGTGSGDDWKDVMVHVEQTGPNQVTVTLLPLQKGLPGYTTSIETKDPNGNIVDVMPNVYRSGGTAPGASAPLAGNINGTPGSGGSGGSPIVGTAGTPGTGVASDYGINENIRKIFGTPSKVLGMDYTYSIVQPASDDWSKAGWATASGKPIFARHFGYANLLYADGSVRATLMTSTNFNPAVGTNAATYYNP